MDATELKFPTVTLRYPTRVSEFRVTYQGQHRPQRPWLRVDQMEEGTYQVSASYDPHTGGGYTLNGPLVLAMPYDVLLPEVRQAMRDLVPAIRDYLAHNQAFLDRGGWYLRDQLSAATDRLERAKLEAFQVVAIRNERAYFARRP